MDKGIRQGVNHKFNNTLPQLATMGNTAFRKEVMFYAMEEYGTTLAAAATHYNHAKIEAAKVPELAAFMVGLGRAEDKKGGRKPKAKVVAEAEVVEVQQTEFNVCKKKDGEVVATGLSFEDAKALVATGRIAGKFCKMYWV